ncbi:MAG: GNAT family N-acetyltransferase [Acutalibacter sp.]|jgi:ribosomal protein S18 acetylase RimI-like enzyme
MARYQESFSGKHQSFIIRNAVGSDAEKLISYMIQVNQETTFLSMEPGEFEASYPVEKEAVYLDSIAQSQDRQLLIAVTPEGEIAGNCRCEYPGDRRRLRHTAVLDISVRKDYWRQGLGRRLMDIQEQWAENQGVEKLCLEVDTANLPAIGLYLRQGFTVEGTLLNQVKLADGTYRNLYVMGKRLK